jgi:hypothetical protein
MLKFKVKLVFQELKVNEGFEKLIWREMKLKEK